MLEPHESLFIDRWRKSLQQREYAQRHKISGEHYRQVESGRVRVPTTWKIPVIENLRPIERFIILRRRTGLTRAQLAKEMKINLSHLDMEETEQRHPSHLQAYWGDKSV